MGSGAEQEGYYLQDTRNIVGDCVLWWRKGMAGYTTDLNEAHLFSKAAAYQQHKNRSSDIPWRAMDVRGISRPMVYSFTLLKLKKKEVSNG